MDRFQSPFGGAESKESGADGKFFAGQTAERIELFKRPPRFEVFGKLGHLPSQYHAFLCGNLYRGIDGWMAAIEYADKMREVQYPVHLIYPEGWDGPKPNPFHSYDEYEEQFLKPILTDVSALRELLRKHKVGEVSDHDANNQAKSIIGKIKLEGNKLLDEDPTLKPKDLQEKMRVSDRHARRIVSGHKAAIAITPKLLNHGGKRDEQADNNKVDYGTSRNYVIARLDRDGHTELAEQVRSGSKSARKAAIEAGFNVPESPLTLLKRAWRKANETERQSFKLFIEVN